MISSIMKNKLFCISLVLLVMIGIVDNAKFIEICCDVGYMCRQSLFILILMFGLLSFMKIILSSSIIKEKISKANNYKSMLLAALLGLVISGPIYPGFTLGKMLLHSGVKIRTIIILLSVWGTLKLPMLPFEIDILGGEFTLARWIVTGIGIFMMSIVCEYIIIYFDCGPHSTSNKDLE